MAKHAASLVLVAGAAIASIAGVLGASVISLLVIYGVRSSITLVIHILNVLGEICVALTAALTSGGTVAFAVFVAVWASAMTVPATYIEMRIGVSVAVAAASIVVCAAVLSLLGALNINADVAAAVISAAAVSVAVAAAWAVAVLSLIEKETQQVGLRMTSILDAVKNNNYRILRILLSFNTGLKQHELNAALIHAIKADFPQCVDALLNHGADCNVHDAYDHSALFIAADHGSYNIVKSLLNKGCIFDEKHCQSKGTALHQASRWGHLDCVHLLLDRGADPNSRDGFWRTPLVVAARESPNPSTVMSALLKAPHCDCNIAGSDYKTALHYASYRGLPVEELLNAGAKTDVQDADGDSCLHAAASEGHHLTLKTLLHRGANPNMKNIRRRTPLHCAASNGYPECLQRLLEYNADVDGTDIDGYTAVWLATSNGHENIVKRLLRYNCSTAATPGTQIPNLLTVSLSKSYLHIAKMLLLAGEPHSPLKHWLLQHLPDDRLQENIEVLTWLKDVVANPFTLSQLCRSVIRRNSKRGALTSVPLPTRLVEYISLKELDMNL